jgi:hypothetical protein
MNACLAIVPKLAGSHYNDSMPIFEPSNTDETP